MGNLLDFMSEACRNILYYGASVTVQRDGFRPLLHQLICKESGVNHNELINGVGGVGSLFCFGNISNVLSDTTPVDLVVHECFTGDTNAGITSPELLPVYLDEFFKVFPFSKHICVLNFRADCTFEELRQVAFAYEAFCLKKNIALIKVFEYFYQDGVPGLPISEAFRDGVHPTPRGAEFISNKIWSEAKLVDCPPLQGENPTPMAALSASRIKFYGFDYLINNTSSPAVEGDFLYKNTGQVFRSLEFESDFQLSLPPGKVLGFLGLTGPKSPSFVHIDLGGAERKFRTFDRNCFYTRPQTFSWPTASAQKQFSLRMSAEAPDFSICSREVPEFESARSFAICGVYMLDES